MLISAEFGGTERFEIRRRIGAGGMGVVYDAYDRERNARVALKTLRSLSPTMIARLKSEFRALQGVAHPNLVGMGELLFAKGQWFFTMEMVDGCDFAAYIRPSPRPASVDGEDTGPYARPADRPPLDEARLRDAAGQLAQALAAIHAAGIIHRDVKPTNVRVTPDGRVVLLDFGLVRDTRPSSDHTTEADVVGTGAYMAPEQVFGGELGPAADWYAFGVMLYEALTGELPHDGVTVYELLAHKQHAPPPPRVRSPDVPADLDRLCADLLAVDPAARPSGEEVLRRLGVPARATQPISSPHVAAIVPCLGRDRELDAIARAFLEVGHGGARAVWIHGASGVGKSTLVGRACEELAACTPGLLVLSGRCYERESVPYKALDGVVDALAHALRRLSTEEAAALLPLHAALLPSLFPALGRVDPIANAPRPRTALLDPQDQRGRAFAALRELFLRLALARPLLVTIDDVQWADADSRLLLSEIMRPPEPPPLLLLLASRTDEGESGDAAPPALLSAIEAAPCTELAVGPLEPPAATELARLLLGPDAARVDPVTLAHEAGGHPLFLAELARHALATHGAEVPVRLDEAIAARAAALPREARHILELVCLAGAPLPQGIARQAVQLETEQVDRQVARLRAEYLVRTSGARPHDPIEPYHDRVREAVAAAMPAASRRARHGALARTLELASRRGEYGPLLVRHWEEAGDRERAARHARDAAVWASHALAFDQAAALWGDALRLGDHAPDQVRALRIERAAALANAGHSAAAADEFLAAGDGAGPGERLELERLAAANYLVSGRLENGLALVGDLLAQLGMALPSTPAGALRALLWSRLKLRLRGMRFVERHEDEIPRQELARVDFYHTVANVLGMVDSIRGADFQARNLLAALRAGEPLRIGHAFGLEIVYRISQGGRALGLAARVTRELRVLADRTGSPLLAAWLEACDGIRLYLGGRFGECRAPLEHAESLFADDTVGTIWERNSLRMWRLWAARQGGALRRAHDLYEETVRDAERRGDRFTDASTRRSLNQVWLVADDPARARAELARAAWLPPEGRFHLQHWAELEAATELALYEGTPGPALVAFEAQGAAFRKSLLPRIQMLRIRHTDLHGSLLVAEAATAVEPDPLRREAARLARKLDGEGLEFARVYAHILRAAIAAQRGRDDAAIAELRAALALCAVTSQDLHAAACRLRLARLVGGDEGATLRAEALTWMRSENAVNPTRLIEVVTPGFPH